MKKQFSNFLLNLTRNGKQLSNLEEKLLSVFFDHVPEKIGVIIKQQFKPYNLLQREIDGRATNFYRIKKGKVKRDDLPKLETKQNETKLMSMGFRIKNVDKNMYVTFWAVDGYFFCMNFSDNINEYLQEKEVEIFQIEKSYKSNCVIH